MNSIRSVQTKPQFQDRNWTDWILNFSFFHLERWWHQKPDISVNTWDPLIIELLIFWLWSFKCYANIQLSKVVAFRKFHSVWKATYRKRWLAIFLLALEIQPMVLHVRLHQTAQNCALLILLIVRYGNKVTINM